MPESLSYQAARGIELETNPNYDPNAKIEEKIIPTNNSLEKTENLRKLKWLPSTDLRAHLLNTDTSQLNLEMTTRYLIALTQEINIAKLNNQDAMQQFLGKFQAIQESYHNFISSWTLSEWSQKLRQQIELCLESIQKGLESKDRAPWYSYEPLEQELTEMEIDDTIQNIDQILKNKPSMIFVWVNKYNHNRDMERMMKKHLYENKPIPNWNLRGAVDDAKIVAQKIEWYPSSNKVELHDEMATKEAILNAIKTSPSDKDIFLYMSWHGVDGHFVPYTKGVMSNMDKSVLQIMISPVELFEAIGKRKAVVIVDHCFSGDLVMSAPDNITIIWASDSMTTALDTIKNDSSIKSEKGLVIRNEIVTGKREKIQIVKGEKVRKSEDIFWWKATFGLTGNKNIPLDIRWFVDSARAVSHLRDHNQQPTINAGITSSTNL